MNHLPCSLQMGADLGRWRLCHRDTEQHDGPIPAAVATLLTPLNTGHRALEAGGD